MQTDSLFSDLDHRQLLSIPDLAKLSGFSYREISTAIRKGRLTGAMRDGRGKWKIPRHAAEQWWANLERS